MIDNQPAGAGVEAEAIAPVDAPVATDAAESTEAAADPVVEPKGDSDDKKLQNAIARRERRIGQLTAQKYQYQADLESARQELAKYKQPQGNSQTSTDAPQETQFETYGDYLKAIARYEARQALGENDKKAQESRQSLERQNWRQEREQFAEEKTAEVSKSLSDFNNVISENSDIIGSIDAEYPELQEVFLEAENAPLALYTLAKEGKLEALLSMSPRQAAMAVARAEERGAALLNKKPVSKAPEPMSALKGVSRTAKVETEMSGDELMKSYGFRK